MKKEKVEDKKKAHVADYKKKTVDDFVRLLKEYPVVGALNVEKMPAPQFQSIRAKLKEQAVIRMTKRRLVKIAIEKVKGGKQGIEGIEEHLVGMPALIFSKESPFKLSKILKKSKSYAPAKAGQIAPMDIAVKAGPTPFAPGPVIGELGSIGLKTAIEGGKVAIVSEKVVVKEGEPVSEKVAAVLARLGITPMEIGLDLVAAYEGGLIFKKDVLETDEEGYLNKIRSASSEAFNLAVYSGYATKETVEFLIKKAFNESKAIALSRKIISDVVVEEMIKEAEREMLGLKESAKIEAAEIKEEIKETKKEAEEMKEEIKEIEKESEIDEKEIEKEAEEREFEKEEIKKIEKAEKVAEIDENEIKKEEIKETEKEIESDEKEEPKLGEIKSADKIEFKKRVTDGEMEQAAQLLKQIQQRVIEEKEKAEKQDSSKTEKIVEDFKKFEAGIRPPSAEIILDEVVKEEATKEPKVKKEAEKVPTIHELMERKKKEKR